MLVVWVCVWEGWAWGGVGSLSQTDSLLSNWRNCLMWECERMFEPSEFYSERYLRGVTRLSTQDLGCNRSTVLITSLLTEYRFTKLSSVHVSQTEVFLIGDTKEISTFVKKFCADSFLYQHIYDSHIWLCLTHMIMLVRAILCDNLRNRKQNFPLRDSAPKVSFILSFLS